MGKLFKLNVPRIWLKHSSYIKLRQVSQMFIDRCTLLKKHSLAPVSMYTSEKTV